jgi:hypothetical protein
MTSTDRAIFMRAVENGSIEFVGVSADGGVRYRLHGPVAQAPEPNDGALAEESRGESRVAGILCLAVLASFGMLAAVIVGLMQ